MHYDVVIVGAGPAGLFAAKEVVEKSRLKTLIVDMGRDVDDRVCPATAYKSCKKCSPCSIMCGVGGAGTLSSGLLNLRIDIGGDLSELVDEATAWDLVKYVDSVFVDNGAPNKIYSPVQDEVEDLERKAAAVGVNFLPIPQRHIGTDNAPKVIKSLKESLEGKGVNFLLKKTVSHIDTGKIILNSKDEVTCKYVIAAPGRSGANWLSHEAQRLKIPTTYQPIDIGVRVEVPAVVMDPVTRISRDPKFHIYSDTYDDFVRTFCVNAWGFVVQEVYDDFIGVNGHSMTDKLSVNTNFAFLVRVALTEPLEDTTAYGRTIAQQTTTLGGGKPLLQRLGDLKGGRRSTWERLRRGNVEPTLLNVTPGDISMGLPHRIVTDLIEGLDKLDHVVPGVSSNSTLIYAPEVKFSANRLNTDDNLETPLENVFVAGDGAGLSRGLVTSAATGVIAAWGLLKKEGIDASQ
ncbi:MAG: NAD(P)/FAD-dependent oxidoreductase [Candidatus Bathyarchaeota archaeon]|nr:NAD(P)/FAD-dependent oxidoreductase [Candidatus Bathyarchaeota archaeon]